MNEQQVTMPATRPPPIPALTGVRFLAAFAVLLFHYGATFAERSGLPVHLARILHNGDLGVSFFFILSGFILTYSHRTDAFNGRFLLDFGIARFARIYPVYLVALMLGLPVLVAPLSGADILKVLTMVQSWTLPRDKSGFLLVMQAWTLSIEVFFYLLFPFILLGVKRLNAGAAGLGAVLTAVVILVFGTSSICPGFVEIPLAGMDKVPLPAFRLAEFVYGMLLCHLTLLRPQLSRAIGGGLPEVILAGAIAGLMAFAEDVHGRAAITVLTGVLIVQLTNGRGPVSAFLSSRPLLLLGGASYAVYLLQGPVRALCDRWIPHPFDRIANPILTISAAIAVFLLIEQPARRAILSAYRSAAPKASAQSA